MLFIAKVKGETKLAKPKKESDNEADEDPEGYQDGGSNKADVKTESRSNSNEKAKVKGMQFGNININMECRFIEARGIQV